MIGPPTTRGRHPSRFRGVDLTAPFSGAMALLLAGLVLLPLYWLLLTSLRDTGTKAFSLDNYRHLFTDPAFVKPLVTTMWTSAAVGFLCLATAGPMAYLVARTD